jgi:hypothetical protein
MDRRTAGKQIMRGVTISLRRFDDSSLFVTSCCLVGDFRRSEEYDVSTFTDSRFVLRPSAFVPQDQCVPTDRNPQARRGRLLS